MKILFNELQCISDNIDIDEYIKYREEVKMYMEHPDWLGDFSKDDLEVLLANGSKIWMYFDNNEFVCSMMLIPSTQKDLDKFNIDFDYREVADYGPQFVSKNYRGLGLQYKMLEELDKYCVNNGYSYAASTIHPDNIYSINNLVKNGFVYKGNREFKRGPRNIYFKKLK